MQIREQAQARLKEMFHMFSENPNYFPPKYRERAEKVGSRRMAVEYIAGMTDHFCDREFRRLKAAK
jgi:dGTPase